MSRAARYVRAVSLLSPSLMSTRRALERPTSFCSIGISALHGGQYVAQKLITTGLPAKSESLTAVPSVACSANAGAFPPAGAGEVSGRLMVVRACRTSGAPQPSPPDASSVRPFALSDVTSDVGISCPTLGTPRYTRRTYPCLSTSARVEVCVSPPARATSNGFQNAVSASLPPVANVQLAPTSLA